MKFINKKKSLQILATESFSFGADRAKAVTIALSSTDKANCPSGLLRRLANFTTMDRKQFLQHMTNATLKPTTTLLCTVILCLLNTFAFGQQSEKSAPEWEAAKTILQIGGMILVGILTAINIYYGIKNQNHKQLKEENGLLKSMNDTLTRKITMVESENQTLEIRKGQLKLENKELLKDNEDLAKENFRLKERE